MSLYFTFLTTAATMIGYTAIVLGWAFNLYTLGRWAIRKVDHAINPKPVTVDTLTEDPWAKAQAEYAAGAEKVMAAAIAMRTDAH